MSVQEIATGKSKIHDNKGRTTVPKEVREAMGLSKGDGIKFVFKDGQLMVFEA